MPRQACGNRKEEAFGSRPTAHGKKLADNRFKKESRGIRVEGRNMSAIKGGRTSFGSRLTIIKPG